ncbi:MAG TPA: TetR family transcriptional regulator [Actinomycetota bacterium]|nr:TetR family transcriptional regulator [Actinomycetota bacterium]
MPPPGRRPGKSETRAAILEAARATFLEEGYEPASLRSIARRAAVDPALVHHYFGGKAELFAEVMKFGNDPRQIAVEMSKEDRTGADLVRHFLGLWEQGRPWEPGLPPFMIACQAFSSSPIAAAGLRQYLQEEVWAKTGCDAGLGDLDARHALVASQLVGLGWVRYVLQLEPIASAPVEQVAAWVGPSIDRYRLGELASPAVEGGERPAAAAAPG